MKGCDAPTALVRYITLNPAFPVRTERAVRCFPSHSSFAWNGMQGSEGHPVTREAQEWGRKRSTLQRPTQRIASAIAARCISHRIALPLPADNRTARREVCWEDRWKPASLAEERSRPTTIHPVSSPLLSVADRRATCFPLWFALFHNPPVGFQHYRESHCCLKWNVLRNAENSPALPRKVCGNKIRSYFPVAPYNITKP